MSHLPPRGSWIAALACLGAASFATPQPASSPEALRIHVQEALECGEAALDAGDSPEEALAFFRQALELGEQRQDAGAMGAAQLRLAWAFLNVGQYGTALAASHEAVALAGLAGDRQLEGRAWGAIGDALYYRNEYAEALEAFRQMLAIKESLNDLRGRAGALKNIGVCFRSLGRLDEALRALRVAELLESKRSSGAPDISIPHNLGRLYERLGAEDLALRRYEQALKVAEQSRKPAEILNLRMTIAEVKQQLGFPALAVQDLQTAIQSSAGLDGLVYERCQLYERLAWSHEDLDQTQAAIDAYRAAINLCRQVHDAPDVVMQLCNLGWLEPDPEVARGLYIEASEVAKALGFPRTWWIDAGFAQVDRRLGNRSSAIAGFGRALDKLESYRGGMNEEVDRIGFGAQTQKIYLELIDLLLDTPAAAAGADGRTAFHVLERARARALLEEIPGIGLDAAPSHDRVLKAQESALRQRLAELRAELEKDENRSHEADLRAQLSEAEVEMDRLAVALRPKAGDRSQRESRNPLDLEQAQSRLDDSKALLSYVLTAKRAYAFLVTSRDFRAVQLPVPSEDIAIRAANGITLLSESAADGWPSVAQRLYRDLFQPLHPHLPPSVRHLIVALDGRLHGLPFEALQDPSGRFIVEDYTVSYTPSATVLAVLDTMHRAPSLGERTAVLVAAYSPLGTGSDDAVREAYADQGFTLSPLAHVGVEARAVEEAFGSGVETFVDPAASESRLKSLTLERFDVLHFATHALLSERTPQRSALVLAPGPDGVEDGFLQARELAPLGLRANLVVLSACQTARGRVVRGEGVQSLAWAFFGAGVRSVVASLWPVEDRGSARFMTAFYRHLADGKRKSEALRLTKLGLLSEPSTASPSQWASFILIGEPDGTVAIVPSARGDWLRRVATGTLGVFGLTGAAWVVLWRRRAVR